VAKKPLAPARQQLTAAQADTAPVLAAWLPILAPGLPTPVCEFRFDAGRAWRFDLCWPDVKLAAEVDGGRWQAGGGRHGSDADYEKLNAAVLAGWRVLRFTSHQVTVDPAGCCEVIAAALLGSKNPHEGHGTPMRVV
jgi:hypothetical protein